MPQQWERRLHPVAIPHLTVILVSAQAAFYLLILTNPALLELGMLRMDKVWEGEVWRLLSFLAIPPTLNPLFLFFALYLFLLMGSTLEALWGRVHYNAYIFIAWLATILVSCTQPTIPATNAYIGGSVFLAFAFLYPNFEIHLFLLFPVKVKWLALLTWISYGFAFLSGPWMVRGLVLAAVANFLLFFRTELITRMRSARYKMNDRAKAIKREAEGFHRCSACGRTEKSDPSLEFRVSSTDGQEYCMEHLPPRQ